MSSSDALVPEQESLHSSAAQTSSNGGASPALSNNGIYTGTLKRRRVYSVDMLPFSDSEGRSGMFMHGKRQKGAVSTVMEHPDSNEDGGSGMDDENEGSHHDAPWHMNGLQDDRDCIFQKSLRKEREARILYSILQAFADSTTPR